MLILRRWSVRIARRLTMRRLDKIEQLLVEIGGLWGDEDQYLVNLADEHARSIRTFKAEIDENIEARSIERGELLMAPRRDLNTIDMFGGGDPKPVVERFDERLIRASTPSERIALAVGAALKGYEGKRAAVAAELSAYLDENVTEAMLGQYASQTNNRHNIPAHRLVALAEIIGSVKLINALLADTGLVAIPAKYEPLIAREMAREEIARLERKAAAAHAQWRAGR